MILKVLWMPHTVHYTCIIIITIIIIIIIIIFVIDSNLGTPK